MEWGASPRRVLLVGAALAVLIACWVVPPHPTRPRPRWLPLPPAPTSPSPTGAAALRAPREQVEQQRSQSEPVRIDVDHHILHITLVKPNYRVRGRPVLQPERPAGFRHDGDHRATPEHERSSTYGQLEHRSRDGDPTNAKGRSVLARFGTTTSRGPALGRSGGS